MLDWRERIAAEPGKRFGKPCIRGSRFAVEDVFSYLAAGETEESMRAAWPELEREDFLAAYAWAADTARAAPPAVAEPPPGKSTGAGSAKAPFTPTQGRYLAFIHAYMLTQRRAPAESDMQRHFGVSAPAIHQMVVTLERVGLIRRQPGVARSIELLVDPAILPPLRPSGRT